MANAAKVMLIDDDESLHVLMRRIVEDAGYEFCAAFDGEQGLRLLAAERPDLLLLDVMMPGMNGFDVCRKMREDGRRIPIVFLSAKGDIVDKSIGFKAGADDYLVKPFTPQELSLRIGALLRRRAPERKRGYIADFITYDGLEIDVKRRRVTVRGNVVDLTPKEFHVLFMLASDPGTVFTRDQLIRDVWGPEYVGESSSITVLVRRIREKIEEDPSEPHYLQTIWHVGYRFGD